MNISSTAGVSIATSVPAVRGNDGDADDAQPVGAPGAAAVTNISGPGKMMQELKELQSSDPAKFKKVVSAMAESLRNDAKSATGSDADRLTKLASRLDKVAETGDLAQLAPQKPANAASGTGPSAPHGHHHHHHGGGEIGADMQKAFSDALASAGGGTTDAATSAASA